MLSQRLSNLRLNGDNLSEKGLEYLASIEFLELKSLDLSSNNISREGLIFIIF